MPSTLNSLISKRVSISSCKISWKSKSIFSSRFKTEYIRWTKKVINLEIHQLHLLPIRNISRNHLRSTIIRIWCRYKIRIITNSHKFQIWVKLYLSWEFSSSTKSIDKLQINSYNWFKLSSQTFKTVQKRIWKTVMNIRIQLTWVCLK